MPAKPRSEPDALVHDWNDDGDVRAFGSTDVELLDETFRDDLQNPSVKVPSLDKRIEILHLMDSVGIDHVVVGMPATSERAFAECLRLCREVSSAGLDIKVACAGRTLARDVRPIVELSQRAGIAVGVYTFVGTSAIRAFAESWDMDRIRKLTRDALDVAVSAGLPTTYVTEDTTRSRPDVLSELFRLAIDHGATRLCLCDTVGHSLPRGVERLIAFTRSIIEKSGAKVGIDWHGHNDRGLSLVNTLAAIEAGADRVHATALGVGERAGNAPMELVLLNLHLLDALAGRDLSQLLEYCRAASVALGWPVPHNYPLVGRDAFRTVAGVHASAILKAKAKGDEWLADRIYSAVPASSFGLHQEICIGSMSGTSNVVAWLAQRDIPPSERIVQRIMAHARTSDHTLTDEELLRLVLDTDYSEERSSP